MEETIVKKFTELSIQELYDLMKLRVDVFVVEQHCPYPEIDGEDLDAIHVMIKRDGEIVAYLRVLPGEDVRIGRVIAKYRGEHLGAKVLNAGIAAAKEYLKAQQILLFAQTYAIGFYEKAGFEVCGAEFLEDDIPHVPMICHLNK